MEHFLIQIIFTININATLIYKYPHPGGLIPHEKSFLLLLATLRVVRPRTWPLYYLEYFRCGAGKFSGVLLLQRRPGFPYNVLTG